LDDVAGMDSPRLLHVLWCGRMVCAMRWKSKGSDSMDNPLMKKDLADSIQELRNEVERRLMRNKYYVAIKKLDDLLEAIRPLEAEVIDDDLTQRTERAALTSQPVLESHPPAPVEPASEEIFAVQPQQQPEPVETLPRQDVFQAVPSEPEAPAPAQPQATPAMPEPVAGSPTMPESLGGNVYPATPPQQSAHLAQPAEEVFQPSTPQQPQGFDQSGNPIDQGQQRQQTDAMFAPRHSAAE